MCEVCKTQYKSVGDDFKYKPFRLEELSEWDFCGPTKGSHSSLHVENENSRQPSEGKGR